MITVIRGFFFVVVISNRKRSGMRMRTNRLYSFLGYVNLIFQYSDMSETETEYLRKYSVFFPKS